MKPRQIASIFSVAVPFIIFSHFYLDMEIARFFGDILNKDNLLSRYASDLPDLLFPVSVLFTVTSWAVYSWLVRRGRGGSCALFFHLTGWSVPLSFLAKTALKDIFGSINTRYWLQHRGQYGFNWFNSSVDFNGFPSGHMVIFTVIILALCRFFPRARHAGAAFLFLLGAALVITDYHFLSDVVAGALLAVLVDASVFNLLFHKKENARNKVNRDLSHQ
jgi:membrane-associated phospholipid phosphatase